LADAYISVIEAIKHASWKIGKIPEISWLNSEDYEKDKSRLSELKNFNGIVIPGGFGQRGVEGKILAIEYARKNKIPILGLCFGLQLMVIEFARNCCNLKGANSTEIDPKTKYPVIDVLKEQKEYLKKKLFGGTMRLGDWPCEIKKGTIAHFAYKKDLVFERHRHRYEVNPKFHKILQKNGFLFSGTSENGLLVEIGELPKSSHPFFLGTQFHPEFKSRFLNPHPLFLEFVKTASLINVAKNF